MPTQSLLADTIALGPQLIKACLQARGNKQLAQAQQLTTTQMAQWLSISPQQIRSVRWENVHAGTTSRSRLLVEYQDDAIAMPTSFFVKTTAGTYSTRVFGVLFGLGRNEVNFYRTIRPLVTIPVPRIYHIDGDDCDFLLLLEDLAVGGCEFADITTRCSAEQAKSVVETLAALHAQFWQSELFDKELKWVNRYETDSRSRLMKVLRSHAVPAAIRKYQDVVPDSVAAAVPLIMETYPLLERLWSKGERTLVHGDAHIGNMYFCNGRTGLLDWQVPSLCQGMRDVSYFLVNSVPTEIRIEHQEDIIRHYLAVLGEHGVNLSLEQAWQQYRLHATYTWISSVVTAAGSHMQSPRIAAAGLARTCKAMVDLDIVAFLRMLQAKN